MGDWSTFEQVNVQTNKRRKVQRLVEGQVTHPDDTPTWRCAGDKPGEFFPFDAAVSASLEASLPRKTTVTWLSRGWQYTLDWSTMEQVNGSNGTRRGVQRVVAGQVTNGNQV